MGPNEDHKGYCTDSNLKGLIPRMIEEIFDRVENSDPDIEFTIQISYIEIYLEKIRDLLDRMLSNYNCIVLTTLNSTSPRFKD